jgi:cell shape-determining protein MreD
LKRALAIALLGVIAPMIQGALSGLLPAGWCPDTSLLLVTALGLVWPASLVGALGLVALHGFVCDLLSGSLLGQHALVSLCTFGAARVVSSHVNLHGAPSQMVLAAGLTAGTAFALNGLTAFFSPTSGPGLLSAGALLAQAAVNSLLAPPVIAAVRGLLARLDDESGRRVLRLEPRRLSL